ncbi:SDR family oxidoreductase [Duganella sp. sic0402]|uniref:SDR family NAD(P)-dependent oxidoreductase n=1 Tax=Duganella sp. sic0402 TaxID=2854786 RepID=UPI001C4518DC|nr:SDR family oxidoreductase [Duganella sp. sic0402]MBV7536288.1 SDR family oxidoreductase [Duganella sp. sic0402]
MKTALITGASSGIGAIYADRLARRGYDLILVARDAAKLSALAAQLGAATGRKVDTISADLGVTADLRRVEQRLASDASISMLVNNAGLGAVKSLIDSTPEELDTLISVNVTALTRLSRAVAPGLVARGAGAIINISSIAALKPELLNGTYGGSKAFVLALTQSLHHELGGRGVQVQAVLPGAIGTPFWDRAGHAVENLPQEWVMSPQDLVDAALAGFDQRELVTLPSLPDVQDFVRMEQARLALAPNLSHSKPAARYLSVA